MSDDVFCFGGVCRTGRAEAGTDGGQRQTDVSEKYSTEKLSRLST